MSDLVCNYIPPNELRMHIWSCVGPEFALHIHITDRGEDRGLDAFGSRYYGGLECHYRKPPEYMADDAAPSHSECWLLKAPCWHDGTSLYASEVIIPFWQLDPTNNERMFDFIRREYKQRQGEP